SAPSSTRAIPAMLLGAGEWLHFVHVTHHAMFTSMKKKQSYAYSVVLTPAEEGGYTVTVPSLPGCITEGDTLDEALANAKECIELTLDCLEAHGDPIPHEFAPAVMSVVASSRQYA
ncbi:MAG: type II toxin-antitoxin system HicB family antitoxin, partial [Patescibacteria group bacterium]